VIKGILTMTIAMTLFHTLAADQPNSQIVVQRCKTTIITHSATSLFDFDFR